MSSRQRGITRLDVIVMLPTIAVLLTVAHSMGWIR